MENEIWRNLSLENMDGEVWKHIPSLKNYMISNLGRVKSIDRYVNHNKGGLKIVRGRIVKQGFRGKYLKFATCENNIKKNLMVHQNVAIAFLNHIPCGHKIVVDHINNIRGDNRVKNLQLITSRENVSKDRIGATSTFTGVYRESKERVNGEKWQSRIFYGKDIYLGSFDTQEEASNYYQDALKAIENGTEIKIKRAEYTSKYKWISFDKKSNRWRLEMIRNKKWIGLGSFIDEESANIARVNYCTANNINYV